jgi:hypothetical protein
MDKRSTGGTRRGEERRGEKIPILFHPREQNKRWRERERKENERDGGLSRGRNGLSGLIGGSKVHCPCPHRLNIAFNILDFASCYCYFRCLARISFYVHMMMI